MSFKTPAAITLGVVIALTGVAGAAVALPSPPKPQPSVALAAPESRTEIVHAERRGRARDDSRPAARAATAPASARHAGFDDSGHHAGTEGSSHRGRGSGGGRSRS